MTFCAMVTCIPLLSPSKIKCVYNNSRVGCERLVVVVHGLLTLGLDITSLYVTYHTIFIAIYYISILGVLICIYRYIYLMSYIYIYICGCVCVCVGVCGSVDVFGLYFRKVLIV